VQSIDASVSYKTIQEMTDAELLAIAAGGADESRYASGEASNGQTTDGVEHIGIEPGLLKAPRSLRAAVEFLRHSAVYSPCVACALAQFG
jgi:hypothetical protein